MIVLLRSEVPRTLRVEEIPATDKQLAAQAALDIVAGERGPAGQRRWTVVAVYSAEDRDDFAYGRHVEALRTALAAVAEVHEHTDLGRDVKVACDAATTAIGDALLMTLELGDHGPDQAAAGAD
jgi:hypothetical protein